MSQLLRDALGEELEAGNGAGDRRIVLIGQAPGPNTHPDLPLFPAPRNSGGGRLHRYTGLSLPDYLRLFQRINLIYSFPGYTGHDKDKFPMSAARPAAANLRPLLAGRRVILVGRAVAKAFGDARLQMEPSMTWMRAAAGRGSMMVASVPHTSGRSLFWNQACNRAAALQFFSDAVREIDIARGGEETTYASPT